MSSQPFHQCRSRNPNPSAKLVTARGGCPRRTHHTGSLQQSWQQAWRWLSARPLPVHVAPSADVLLGCYAHPTRARAFQQHPHNPTRARCYVTLPIARSVSAEQRCVAPMNNLAKSTLYAWSASVSTAAGLGARRKRRRPPAVPLDSIYQAAVALSTPTAAAV